MKRLIAVGVVAIAITYVGAEAAEDRSLSVDALATAMSACADCYICDPDIPDEYVPAVSTNPEYDFGIFANYCNENPLIGDCGDNDPCPAEALADATAALTAAGDAEKLGWLVNARPQHLAYVAERGAIQLKGCTGKVIAQYPVSPGVAAVLGGSVVAVN